MSKDSWFRRETWTQEDRDDFFGRLARARSYNRPQYLRIQALHLEKAGLAASALELLDQVLRDYPDDGQVTPVLHQRARCFIALGRDDEAIDAFRQTLRWQKEHRGWRTGVWEEFLWFVARRGLSEHYDEAVEAMSAWKPELVFPIQAYRVNAALALIANEEGDLDSAKKCAHLALEAASRTTSGLRYHPDVGVVREFDNEIQSKLWRLVS